MIAVAVTPLSAEIILLQFALATTLDGICVLIPLKFCRAQCKSRRFATETRLDACEEAEIAPVIAVHLTTRKRRHGTEIVIADNGPGIPSKTVTGVIDYSVRVSSREVYASPTRGAQGNALKTILPMGYVLSGARESETVIEAHGIAHTIRFAVDQIRQEPMVTVDKALSDVRTGTRITVFLPANDDEDFPVDKIKLLCSDFCWLDPHLTLRLVHDRITLIDCAATNPDWVKWVLPTRPLHTGMTRRVSSVTWPLSWRVLPAAVAPR
jgi:hypothetical protein